MSVLLELLEFMRIRGKFWLLPLLLVFVFIGGILVISQGSVIAPFIYTLF